MKASAALSIDSKYVAPSASVSHRTNVLHLEHKGDVKNKSGLGWSARGGNTLLCASPSEWANSVASFQTWRTLEQEVYFIPDLVAKIPNTKTSAEKDEQVEYSWSDVPEVFELINRQQFNKVPARPPGTWRGKIRLETDDGRRLIVKDNKLLMTTDAHPDNEVIFTVLDADMKRKKEAEPRLDKVQADHPLFLVTGRTYGREPQESGAQIPGLWADATGVMRTESDAQRKICRWSFRPKDSKVDFEHRWTPDQTVIRDGDEVKIYCHSYHSGAFRSVDEPTYYAPPAMTKTGEPNLRVLEFDQSTWKKFRLQFSIDKSELGFMRTDGQETQSHMDDFDRGMENELQRAELATYRKFFGAIEI